jgi:hypothetical protein
MLRCGGVTIETTDTADERATLVYYYGCDDFVLPTPLPEL